MPESVLDVDFGEVADHVLGLIFGVIDLLYSVKYYDEYYFVRHDTCFLQKVFIALLNTFNGRFQHMLRFTIHTYTDG
jgi:hypothetical protein